MKQTTILLLFSLLFLISCGNDEEDCTQSTWLGSYSGTEECDNEVLNVDISVSANEEDLMAFMVNYNENEYILFEEIPRDNCSVNFNESEPGEGSLNLNGTLNGDELTFNFVLTIPDEDPWSCTYTATRN